MTIQLISLRLEQRGRGPCVRARYVQKRVCVHRVTGGKFKRRMSAEPGRNPPYTRDIGWRVVWHQIGMERQFRDIARHLQIALSRAHRIFRKFEQTEEIDPRKQPSRPYTHVLDDQHYYQPNVGKSMFVLK